MTECAHCEIQADTGIIEPHECPNDKKPFECKYCFNPPMPGSDICYECDENPFRPPGSTNEENK